jgi:hypothetical protein
MRNALLLVLTVALCLTPNVFASGDIAITSFTADKTSVESGGDVTLVLRARNNGPNSLSANLNIVNSYEEQMHVLSATAVSGWQCSAAVLNCYTESLPAGAQVSVTYHLVVPPTVKPAAFKIIASIGTLGDTDLLNNRSELPIELHPSNHTADLSIAVSSPPNPIPQNTEVTFAYDVRNNGLQDLSDVRVMVHIPLLNLTRVLDGVGWTCTAAEPFNATCRRDSLAANANAPFSVRFTTPAVDTNVNTQASVFAGQAHVDANVSNNRVYRSLSIGDAAHWTRILVPFAASETPGANGSLWIAETSALIEGDTYPELGETACGPIEDPCGYPPLNQLFDASEDLLFDGQGPQFVYVGSAGASKLKMATRVYDASKNGTTAGAFIPMARDEDFSSGGFSLIAIPVAEAFRATLRLYDANGVDGGEAEVALYGDAESEPFLTGNLRLATIDGQAEVTSALLPLYPAFAQIDLTQFVPTRYTQVRARIRPLVPGSMKLWGFASITNNQTSHVTVVTP